jgi:glycosyltransferase involved in cell wall biosynthesis
MKHRFAVVIPVYNHSRTLEQVINQALKLNLPVIVVDDGSTESFPKRINRIPGVNLLRHKVNQGKGAAIITGLIEAAKTADFAITMDADGQHCPDDALTLIQAIPDNSRPIIVGKREGMLAKAVPWTSRFGRRFSNFWVWVAGGPRVSDSQSGFRIYPLPETINLDIKAQRYQFEVEVLVRARWNNIQIFEAPVGVDYSPQGQRISHFRPGLDFIRNTLTFSRLITKRILSSKLFRVSCIA